MEIDDDHDYDSFIPAQESSSPIRRPKLKRFKKAKAIPPCTPSSDSLSKSKSKPKPQPQPALDSSRVLDFSEDNEPLLRSLPYGSADADEGENGSDSIDSLLAEGKHRPVVKRVLGFDEMLTGDMEGVDSELGLEDAIKVSMLEGFDDVLEEKMKVAERRAEGLNFTDVDELLLGSQPSESTRLEEGGNKSDSIDSLLEEGKSRKVKRALDFDGGEGFDELRNEILTCGVGGKACSELGLEGEENWTSSEEFGDELEYKKTKKRAKGADGMPKVSKRKEKQETKAHIVECQRQMRERRDTAFKPVPLVRKPISSLLEKIRQRKQEMSQSLRKLMTENGFEDIPSVKIRNRKCKNSVLRDVNLREDKFVVSPADGSDDKPVHDAHPHSFSQQDLFTHSLIGETQDETSKESGEAMEEDLTPSLSAMNLKLDSALPEDDDSSDEEDFDKENIDPLKSLPNGDPVKKFLDEEAEEENDSDDDPMRFEDEEDDNVDVQELDDIIATDYNEKITDHEKRNELHQMWLEQQDEAGTENLLQRLRYGSKEKEAISLTEDGDEEKGTYSADDESGDEDLIPNVVRMSTKKLQKMIPLMFTDKDDVYVSSDDEETEKMLSKQRLIEKVELEEVDRFVLPSEDETPREVFRCIKKLNILPEAKKAANTSYLDTLLTKGGSGGSVKSSFLSRASKSTVSSSNRHGSSSARSFIFARDGNNSSSVPVPEDTSDENHENKIKRNGTAKFMSSQATFNSQRTQISSQTTPGTSLFGILRGSSIQTRHCTTDSMASHDAVLAAFKSVKRKVRLEGKS